MGNIYIVDGRKSYVFSETNSPGDHSEHLPVAVSHHRAHNSLAPIFLSLAPNVTQTILTKPSANLVSKVLRNHLNVNNRR